MCVLTLWGIDIAVSSEGKVEKIKYQSSGAVGLGCNQLITQILFEFKVMNINSTCNGNIFIHTLISINAVDVYF